MKLYNAISYTPRLIRPRRDILLAPVRFKFPAPLCSAKPFLRSHYSSNTSPNGPLVDPTRPDLFYHFCSPPTPISSSLAAFALSFVRSPPPSLDSPTIIGWLPAEATFSKPESQQAGLNDFRENVKFRDILHESILEGLCEGVDEIQINGATQVQNGWMHIHDDRNIPPLGRIGDPDDIIASVLVQDGKIITETYQPMPSYRLCTSDGILKLTPGLAQKLHSTLLTHSKS
ncbi:hypothetical protein BD779DRAFT_1436270 [Infundibulicybe gibba]|nr:hypothetical protein BD779DRAFT_1436270 [Infundibulicybe gibba]